MENQQKKPGLAYRIDYEAEGATLTREDDRFALLVCVDPSAGITKEEARQEMRRIQKLLGGDDNRAKEPKDVMEAEGC